MRALRTTLLAGALGLAGLALAPATGEAHGYYYQGPRYGYVAPRPYYRPPPPPVYYAPPPRYYAPPPPRFYGPPPPRYYGPPGVGFSFSFR